ncbi:MAG: mannose-1-phosphate guanylyltransferase/mannose-6-phosphate isomerase [Desulfobacterales bacterium]|jgi:mannose-1-phosphate guanylyltransferase/mannose-6-phosphate isomerase|nr:mannose-1-phosphate guanylyltransferase/mannose-6-phosphate isomerase [Desulfobacterales bacterium]
MPEEELPVYAVLLAGGSGTRLWPVSRELYPKQLVKLIGKDSLVQNTIKRLGHMVNIEHVRIVCGQEHYYEIGRHMADVGIDPKGKIIREPCGRNTGPAVLLGVMHVLKQAPDAVICVFPADHVIRDSQAFQEKLSAAVRLAQSGHVVTFGIRADFPETGYGYIEGEGPVEEGALSIKRFVEKPDLETARRYIDAGNYFWNSGMFAFRASVIAGEFKQYEPALYEKMREITSVEDPVPTGDYEQLSDISIDVAIMERTDKGVVLPSDFGWSDIGSWKSLYDFLPKDGQGNILDGDVIAEKTKNCFVMGAHRLVATHSIENLVVVDTPDSVFISNLENSRDVKSIVSRLKEAGRGEYHHHRTVYYPWGTVTLLGKGDGYRVERISLYPGHAFPMTGGAGGTSQLTVTQGTARLTIGDKKQEISRGQSVGISQFENTTIENIGKMQLHGIHVRVDRFHDNSLGEFPKEMR